jgi:predicted amidohydrolase
LHDSIRVALVNIRVYEKDIESSYLEKPNLSRERFKGFSKLLNDVSRYRDVERKKIDLVVFPEVSVPNAWESMLVRWVRRHHIGVVCGMEHKVNSVKEAVNQVLTVLPFKSENGFWVAVPVHRLKRHYSPEEKFTLINEGMKIPKMDSRYHLFRYCGASFAVYNCYELTSIQDRALFKGEVDFIVATEFNRDTNYFSNIVESAARDLHCYIVQVNDSNFGDSRVVSPSKTELMNPLRIKGGDNSGFLTMKLDLKGLRAHQRKGYGLQKESKEFKPTPPDFSEESLQRRNELGDAK